MKYIENFIEDTMHVSPIGKAGYTEGFEPSQYELTVDGKETGIYFVAEDYANWLEKQLDYVLEHGW